MGTSNIGYKFGYACHNYVLQQCTLIFVNKCLTYLIIKKNIDTHDRVVPMKMQLCQKHNFCIECLILKDFDLLLKYPYKLERLILL